MNVLSLTDDDLAAIRKVVGHTDTELGRITLVSADETSTT